MKLCGALLCEILNVTTILQSNSVGNVIKDFIAFGIIADIDDIVASISFGDNIPDLIAEADLKRDIRDNEKSDIYRAAEVIQNLTP